MNAAPKLFLGAAAGNNRGDPVYESVEEAFPTIPAPYDPLGSTVFVQLRLPALQMSGAFEVSEEDRKTERDNCQVGQVIAVGPLAFRNRETAEMWPEGAWCKVGDFVFVPKYQGERKRIKHKRSQKYFDYDGTERVRTVTDDLEVALFKDLAILGRFRSAEDAMAHRDFQ